MREMQSRTALRFHLTPLRMAIIKKTEKQMLVRMRGKELYTAGGTVN
jgi:hypothetical protein